MSALNTTVTDLPPDELRARLAEASGAGPGTPPPMSVPGPAVSLYADIAAMLDGGDISAPSPDYGICTDGMGLFYAGQVNIVMGDPESGKTLLVQAAAVQVLMAGGCVAMLDCDHNGPAATIARMLDLGAPEAALRDPARFRYCDPDDGDHVASVVRDLRVWAPQFVIVDSIGELLPMYGANSNSADDYTSVNRAVLVPLAKAGSAVVGIDHLAKNTESRQMGATGTAAKKRVVGGTALRVTLAETFTPGKGGAAHVAIVKDRHGGLRANRPTGDREPIAATFRIHNEHHSERFVLIAPDNGDRNPTEAAPPADVEALQALDPPPSTVEDARSRMRWQKARALKAMRAFRAIPDHGTLGPGTAREPGTAPRDPGTHIRGGVPGTACKVCDQPLAFDDGTGVHVTCEVPA